MNSEKESFYVYEKQYAPVEKEDIWEYDEVSGHLFCKYCGNNYLLHEHKKDCKSLKK